MNKLRNIGDFSAEYTSPSDFVSTYTSANTITLSALPFTITDSSQIKYILQIKSDGKSTIYRNGIYGVTLTISSNVITIGGVSNPFSSGDVYEVGINSQKKSYDPSTNSILTSPIKNVWNQYIDSQTLVSAEDIGVTDDTWKDIGSEISCIGYKTLGLYVNYTANNSIGATIQVVVKHESGGADEYILDAPALYKKTIGDANIKVAYFFDVAGIPYIQLQSKATTVGATEGAVTIDYVLEY